MDGKTGLMAPDAGTTLQAVLEALRRNISSRRRVIVSFILDGERVEIDKLGEKGGKPPGEFGLLEVKTADPFQFSVGTLSKWSIAITSTVDLRELRLNPSCSLRAVKIEARIEFAATGSLWSAMESGIHSSLKSNGIVIPVRSSTGRLS